MVQLKLFVTTLLLAIVLSTGCVSRSTHQKVLDELSSTKGQLGEVESDRDAKKRRITELEGALSAAKSDLETREAVEKQKEERINALLSDMKTTQAELLELRKQQDAAQERLKAFRDLSERFRALVDTGKLQVAFRNGQMVLKLPSEVLFASGQGELSSSGQAALAEVLEVLKQFNDRRFLIAGHTDNVQIRGRKYKNNWHLSTARAVSVVEFMIANGFEAKNVAAAGHGEFDPIAPNDSEANRQINRRIEIILVPDLSELPNLTTDPS